MTQFLEVTNEESLELTINCLDPWMASVCSDRREGGRAMRSCVVLLHGAELSSS